MKALWSMTQNTDADSRNTEEFDNSLVITVANKGSMLVEHAARKVQRMGYEHIQQKNTSKEVGEGKHPASMG